MRQVGYDPESGQFDTDIVETGISVSQRDRRRAILETIGEQGGATLAELTDAIDAPQKKLEYDVDVLKHEKGQIFDAGSGVLKKA